MKITIKNLGAVTAAEIDLKPLTVFVGHNGTGKTWTAYALAAIFDTYGFKKYLDSYLEGKTEHKYHILDLAFEKFLEDGSAELDIVLFAEENLQIYFNEVAKLAPDWLGYFLSTRQVGFKELSIVIDLEASKKQLLEKIKSLSIDANLTIVSKELKVFKEADSEFIFFSLEEKKKTKQLLPPHRVRDFFYGYVFRILHIAANEDAHFFPTERTTLITIPVAEPKDRELDSPQGKDTPIALQSMPINFLLRMIRSTPFVSLDARIGESESTPLIQHYLDLADFLEKNILGGHGDYEKSEIGIGHELLFSTANVKLEMAVTSSMTKELMPLVLYLRYWAEPNELIVIDEPEMHLHPAAQVEIIEFLAMLVDAGLNVLITTHSPYIVDHIANLIAAKKQPNPETIKQHFYLEDARAFIDQDKVSVQLFEENTAKTILADDGSINWETFWNVSSDVAEIYAELLKNKVA